MENVDNSNINQVDHDNGNSDYYFEGSNDDDDVLSSSPSNVQNRVENNVGINLPGVSQLNDDKDDDEDQTQNMDDHLNHMDQSGQMDDDLDKIDEDSIDNSHSLGPNQHGMQMVSMSNPSLVPEHMRNMHFPFYGNVAMGPPIPHPMHFFPMNGIAVNQAGLQMVPQHSMPNMMQTPHSQDEAPLVPGNGDSKYVDITPYLALPQAEAAKKLSIPTSTLSKRWKEAVRGRKWPYRSVCKLDKEIMTLLHNIPHDMDYHDRLPPDIEKDLADLLRRRQEELKPVIIRL